MSKKSPQLLTKDITIEENRMIIHILETFISERHVSCSESVMQLDDANLSAADYMADIIAVIQHRIK